MGGEENHGLRRGGEKSGDRLMQNLRSLVVLSGENIFTLVVHDAHVNMKAIAGEFAKGFRHEAGDQIMFVGDAFDRAPEEDRLIGGGDHIRLMHEIDFELSGAAFDDGRAERQALRFASGVKIGEKPAEIVELADGVHARIADPAPAAPGEKALAIELNKLEPNGEACRAYLVLKNGSARAFESLKLDLVMFDSDGVVAKRLAVQAAPLPSGKTSLKVFDITGHGCGAIGSILLNDVLACEPAAEEGGDCLGLIAASARGPVPFIK